MQDLNDLFYFSQVVDQGGFSAAARVLDLPKSRLSRRISQLEERLGVRLLQRTTRRLRLTTAGERYLHYCREMTSAARAADEAMRQMQTQPAGPVIVSCPISIAQQLLAPLLPEFLDTWPEVSIQMLATNRWVDLISEGVDLALRVRTKLDTDAELVVRQLGAATSTLVASPAYLQRHGTPESPEALVQHNTLSFNDPQTEVIWSLHDGQGQERAITVAPAFAAMISSCLPRLPSGDAGWRCCLRRPRRRSYAGANWCRCCRTGARPKASCIASTPRGAE
ncbi:bacterial regulatory helix-turn-helix, lysR family protein [Bordetella holmesii 70147]|nr:bacterial regulatory helix-turn-helix, lysR family protein [Bordetella holmesii 70147]